MVDIDKSHYNTGTAEVVGTAVTGTGTAWLGAVRKGDQYGTHLGFGVRIDEVIDNTHLTLAYAVAELDQADGPYEIQRTPYDIGYLQAIEDIIRLMGEGALPSLADVDGTGGDKLIKLTGPNIAEAFEALRLINIAATTGGGVIELAPNGDAMLVPKTDLVSGVAYDVQVDTLADRAAYNGQAEGFSVLVANVGDGRAAVYAKASAASGDWTDPAYVTGPAITLAVTEVDEVPYGTPPDVTLTPVAGGYNMAFEIPRGMVIEPGTTTTLASDQPASVEFVPITGGFRLDISLPRGPTGDIDGVTPFWQDRIFADTTKAQALVGLGAVSNIRNLCHNPGFQVWQNPWSPRSNMPHRWILADGFLFGNNSSAGTARFTGSKVESGLPSGVTRGLRIECTTAESSLGSTSEAHLRYVVPAPRAALVKDATLQLKFSARSNKLGKFTATVLNELRTAGFVFEYEITASGVWQEFSVPVDMSARLGTWNFSDSGYGIGIRWGLVAAPAYRAAGTGWQSGNIIGGPNQVNLADTVGNYWELSKVQFCAGELPSFTLPDYEAVWEECQAQCQVINTTSGGVNLAGWGAFGNAVNFDLLLGRPMYAPPVVDFYNVDGTNAQLQTIAGDNVAFSALTSYARSRNIAKFSVNASTTVTIGTPMMLRLITDAAHIVLNGHF